MTKKPKPSSDAIVIDIAQESQLWPDMNALIERAAHAALAGLKYKGGAELSVVLTDDAEIQKLNKQWRGKDKPTNVLSFPQEEEGLLGDIVMAYETMAREAQEQNKSLQDHTAHLVVHGILHLMGHDHELGDEEEAAMESLEISILEGLGIKNPYEAMDSAC